jgi:xanthine dehydrogenase molybdenum-binding subunit
MRVFLDMAIPGANNGKSLPKGFEMALFSVVGQRVPRVDAREKVKGTAIFSGDVALPHMLYGRILRSPYAHARIQRLDLSQALSLKDVKAVVTAADVPYYRQHHELTLHNTVHLAKDKVVYESQPVVAVAATSLEAADMALGLIHIDYEPLTPVFDVEEAIKSGSPLVHADLYPNRFSNPTPSEDEKPGNIAFHFIVNNGNAEFGFQEADLILEETYRTSKISHGFIEPFVAVATVSEQGGLVVWAQTQGIFPARASIARFLAMSPEQIRLIPVEIGGAFGGKTYKPLAPLCALLALKSGRPVRMEMSREEVFKDTRPAPETRIAVKIGATRAGTITAASAQAVFDHGAYPEASSAMFAMRNMFCQYKIPNVHLDLKDVLTNKVPSGYYRAPAGAQINYAIESLLDRIANEIGLDPIEFRLLNIAAEGDIMPGGEPLPRVGFRETLERLAAHLKTAERPTANCSGRGIACGFWRGGSSGFGAHIRVNADGSVNLLLGITDISGSRTGVAQIVAEELCLPFAKVHVISGDTDTAPWGAVSASSMTVYSLSAAVFQACEQIKTQMASRAAAKLEVEADMVFFADGLFSTRSDPARTVSFEDLAGETVAFDGPGPLLGSGATGTLPIAPTLSAHAADVVVDEETGVVTVTSYAVAEDVGRAVNPLAIEGQIQGAVVQGIGWALMEGYQFSNGVVQNANLHDYKLPTALDVPPMTIHLVEVPSVNGTYGLRHVGEPPMTPVLAALANAVYDAVGVRFKQLPMTPESVLDRIGPERNDGF